MHTEEPLYVQVKNALVQNLMSDPLGDDRLPSYRDITKDFDVSTVTAIKAIDVLKAEGVVGSRPGKGLFVKDREKLFSLYSAPTPTVGVTFLDIHGTSSMQLSEIMRGVSDECVNQALNIQVFSTPLNSTSMEDNPLFWKNIRMKHIDGLIIASRMPINDIMLLREEGIPFVWVTVDLPDPDIHSIVVDKLYAINTALMHLSRLGHQKVALLCAEEDESLRSQFHTLSAGYGMQPESFCTDNLPEMDAGYLLAKQAVSDSRPDAIITRGAEMTASAVTYLSEAGLELGRDIGMVGYTHSLSGYYLRRDVTVILSPIADMARRAVVMLKDILDGKDVNPRKVLITPTILIRGSCGYPMGDADEITINSVHDLLALPYGS